MQNETSETQETPEKTSTADKAKALAGAARKTSETMGKAAEGVGLLVSTIKWVAIAASFGFIAFIGYSGYKIVSAPAKAVGSAADAVTDSVTSGANSVKDGASDILNRLDVPTNNQARLNILAEDVFDVISQMKEVPPEGVKQRVHWASYFTGHENKVCALSMSFGGDPIDVLVAADNNAHMAAKALGSKNDRKIRIVLRAPGDDVPLNVVWDNEGLNWGMSWKRTTVGKALTDADARQRITDVLELAAKSCAR